MRKNPIANMDVWSSALETGKVFLDSSEISQAEQYLRSAVEAGHIYCNGSHRLTKANIQMFFDTLSQLTKCLNLQHQFKELNEVLCYGIDQFGYFVTRGIDRKIICKSYERLMEHQISKGLIDNDRPHFTRPANSSLH